MHDQIVLNAAYSAIVEDYARQLGFESEDAGSAVNEWVNMSTNRLIGSVVDKGPLTPWLLLAINTIYLKASWSSQFDEVNINADAFYTGPSRNTVIARRAHFMHQIKFFRYSHDALAGF